MCFYKSCELLLFTVTLLYLKGINGHNRGNAIYYYFHRRELRNLRAAICVAQYLYQYQSEKYQLRRPLQKDS